jgi:hypothetical protein
MDTDKHGLKKNLLFKKYSHGLNQIYTDLKKKFFSLKTKKYEGGKGISVHLCKSVVNSGVLG